MSQALKMAQRILIEESFAYFCTTDIENGPHVVPVFFVFDPTRCHAYFLFSSDSKKVRNLQLNPKVCFAVDMRDHVNPLENKGVMIQGEASVEPQNDLEPDKRYITRRFEEKYGWSSSQSLFRREDAERIAVDIRVTKVSCWRGPSFFSCPSFCLAQSRRCCQIPRRLTLGSNEPTT